MSDLVDLFPGFASRTIATDLGRIFARIGGNGPPLLLLHGFPETMAMWHRVVPALASHFTVVLADLPGYGWSAAPDSEEGRLYMKRNIGAAMVAVMGDLGHVRFALAGHDRGARVGYRLGLDHPGCLTALALLDIVPTREVWAQMATDPAVSPHWRFLAQPAPEPEAEIAAGPDAYFEGLMRKWAGDQALSAFAPEAMAHYRAAWGDPSRIHAMCEDYRAGALQDRQADDDDLAARTTLQIPVHILASSDYLDKPGKEPALAIWRRTFAPRATGTSVGSGHFMAEEASGDVAAALLRFFGTAVGAEAQA